MSHTVFFYQRYKFFCPRKSLSVTHILCLYRQSVSLTDSLFLSQTACVCHRQPVSVTEKYVFVKDCLCLVKDNLWMSHTFSHLVKAPRYLGHDSKTFFYEKPQIYTILRYLNLFFNTFCVLGAFFLIFKVLGTFTFL